MCYFASTNQLPRITTIFLFKGGGFPAFWFNIGLACRLFDAQRERYYVESKNVQPSFRTCGYSAGAICAVIFCCMTRKWTNEVDRHLNKSVDNNKVMYNTNIFSLYHLLMRCASEALDLLRSEIERDTDISMMLVEKILYSFLENLLPKNAHLLCSDSVAIILTEPNLKMKLVTQWKTRKELIECVCASCRLPHFDMFSKFFILSTCTFN